MKRVLFIDTHLGSGFERLYRTLDNHPRIQGYREDRTYHNVETFLGLTSMDHKCRHLGAIYLDVLTQNQMVAQRDVYEIPYHIFLIREPAGALAEIGRDYGSGSAESYYRLRLRRLLSVACRARHGVVVTHQELEDGRGWDLIERMLNLKPGLEPVVGDLEKFTEAPYRGIVACQDAFERCLFGLRSFSGFLTT